jgi:hypothetical protein
MIFFYFPFSIFPGFFGEYIFPSGGQERQQHLGDTRQMLPRRIFCKTRRAAICELSCLVIRMRGVSRRAKRLPCQLANNNNHYD